MLMMNTRTRLSTRWGIMDSPGMYSSGPENQELFRREAGELSLYAQSNDREYFAEAFRLYITDPVLLGLIFPESTKLVNGAISFL